MLQTLAVANYRSLTDFIIPLGRLNVVTGPNGSGKSSVYRALRLLAQAAEGRLVQALAREGGLSSTLWAGPERLSRAMHRGQHPVQGTVRDEPVNLRLGFAGEEFGYMVDLGLPIQERTSPTMFRSDPHIKSEQIWAGPLLRPATLVVERRNALVRIRQDKEWEVLSHHLAPFDSMLPGLADPHRAPEILQLRAMMQAWRFYDHFRTDNDAPARKVNVGTYTPVLSDDGHDLAAALQTIIEIGDEEALHAAIDDAFPGASIEIRSDGARFEVLMQQHGLLRPFTAAEFSDGTLRYLLWVAALLSPRPPGLLVLNEPETSLHPDLLPALGRLICTAAKRTQVIVVTHANRLLHTLSEFPECQEFCLAKEFGATQVLGLRDLDRPAWKWAER